MTSGEHRVKIDWRRLAAIDLADFREQLIASSRAANSSQTETDGHRRPSSRLTSDIIDMIYNIANCGVEDEFDVERQDPNLVKLFKVGQILLNYMVRELQRLSDLENELESHRDLKLENKKLRKLLEIHQQALSFSGAHLTSFAANGSSVNGTSNGPSVTEDDYLQCPFCPKAFFDVNFLKSHVQRRHPRDAVENEGAFELTRKIAAYQQALCPSTKISESETEAAKKMVESLKGQIDEIKGLLDATQQELILERQERERVQERIEIAVLEKVKELQESIQEKDMQANLMPPSSDRRDISMERSPSPSIDSSGGEKDMSFAAEMRLAKHLEKLVMIQTQEMAKIGSSVQNLVTEFRKQGASPTRMETSNDGSPHISQPRFKESQDMARDMRFETQRDQIAPMEHTQPTNGNQSPVSIIQKGPNQGSGEGQAGNPASGKRQVPPKAEYKPKDKRSNSLDGNEMAPKIRFITEKVSTPPGSRLRGAEKREINGDGGSPKKIRSQIEEQLMKRIEQELNTNLKDGKLTKKQYDQAVEKLSSSRGMDDAEINQVRHRIAAMLDKALDVEGEDLQLDVSQMLQSLLLGKINSSQSENNEDQKSQSFNHTRSPQTSVDVTSPDSPSFAEQKRPLSSDSPITDVAPVSPESAQFSATQGQMIQPPTNSGNLKGVRKGLLKIRDPNSTQKSAAQKRIRFAEHRIEISPSEDSGDDEEAIEIYDEVITTNSVKTGSRSSRDEQESDEDDQDGWRSSKIEPGESANAGLNRPKEAPPPVPAIRKTMAPLPKIKNLGPLQPGGAGFRRSSDSDRERTEQMMDDLLRGDDFDAPKQSSRSTEQESKSVQELTQMIEEQLTRRSNQTVKPPAGSINTVSSKPATSHDTIKKSGLDYDSDLDDF